MQTGLEKQVQQNAKHSIKQAIICLLVSSKLLQALTNYLAPSTVKLKTQSLPPRSANLNLKKQQSEGWHTRVISRNSSRITSGEQERNKGEDEKQKNRCGVGQGGSLEEVRRESGEGETMHGWGGQDKQIQSRTL